MISGICDICGNVGFIRTCRLCGKRVCTLDYDSTKSSCHECTKRGLRGVGF